MFVAPGLTRVLCNIYGSTVKHPNFSFGSYKADFPADFDDVSCGGEWTTVGRTSL